MNIIDHANEIKRLKQAITRTKSKYLIKDYTKAIKRLERDLKEYCMYTGANYKEIING